MNTVVYVAGAVTLTIALLIAAGWLLMRLADFAAARLSAGVKPMPDERSVYWLRRRYDGWRLVGVTGKRWMFGFMVLRPIEGRRPVTAPKKKQSAS